MDKYRKTQCSKKESTIFVNEVLLISSDPRDNHEGWVKCFLIKKKVFDEKRILKS